MLAELVDHVIGVDPDRDRFTVAVLDAATLKEIDWAVFNTNPAGYQAAIQWAEDYSSVEARAWAVEGTGCYGSGLAQSLNADGEWVIEYDHPSKPAAVDGAKSDHLDAVRAARETLGRLKWAEPRARGAREGLRALVVTRRSVIKDRTRAINELKALVLTAPIELREPLRDKTIGGLVKTCSRFRPDLDRGAEVFATKTAMRALARRVDALTKEAAELQTAIEPLVNEVAPQLLDEVGVGYIIAAQLIVSWSHPSRCRNVAAFRRLSGTAPIEATSGQTQTRHRLNRGGDRQLNSALHRIVLVRARHDPATIDYIGRRVADGKTQRDARRCLKNYLARHIYRILENPPTTT